MTKVVIKILLLAIGAIYVITTFAFITMCLINYDDWDMFQAKDEIVQFEEGIYLDAVTFHWFEIELCAMPSKIGYYFISYYFFLKHR